MPEFQLSSKPRLKCRCGKVRAMDLADAKRMVKYVTVKSGHDNPVRYYQCGFGGWHWTRMLVVNGKPEGATEERKTRVCAADDCDNSFSRPGKYCTSTCSNRASKHRKKARDRESKALEKICEGCGKQYTAASLDQRFHSKACRKALQWKLAHPITPLTIAKMLGES